MNKREFNTKDLINAQNRAAKKAKKIVRIFGLKDTVARNNKVIQVHPDGVEIVLKESRFKTKKANKGTFILVN